MVEAGMEQTLERQSTYSKDELSRFGVGSPLDHC